MGNVGKPKAFPSFCGNPRFSADSSETAFPIGRNEYPDKRVYAYAFHPISGVDKRAVDRRTHDADNDAVSEYGDGYYI